MPAGGGEPKRISFGQGRYGTPVWSPRGDLIAFTKQNKGRFHIGVMRTDGGEERLLTASFLDEGPTWAPNGRVIMFTRETQGASGASALYSVDVSGATCARSNKRRRVGPGMVAVAGIRRARFQDAPDVIEQAHKKRIQRALRNEAEHERTDQDRLSCRGARAGGV